MKKKVRAHNWRALDGKFYSPHVTVREYANGTENEAAINCYYTDLVEWSDPNGGKVRLVLKIYRGEAYGKTLYGVSALAVTNYLGFKDKYFVGKVKQLEAAFEKEIDARWYCHDLLNSEYEGAINIDHYIN